MKIRVKTMLSIFVCILVFGLCACSNQKEESTKTGVVIEATMHNLTIEASDKSTYSFITDDDTVFDDNGEALGDTVTVVFEGEYEENALAKKITVDKKAEASSSEDGNVDETENKDSEIEIVPLNYVTGVVKDASMNNITVEWNDSDYTILKDDETAIEGDVLIDAKVGIYYTGVISDGAIAVKISAVNSEGNVPSIAGKVTDATMNTLVIEVSGKNYLILKDDNTVSDSVLIGDTVSVSQNGDYSDGLVASSIVRQ